AGGDRCEWYRVRGEHTRPGIEIQDVDLVRAEVDAEHVTPVQVREDLVRVRRLLALGIGPSTVAGAEEDVGHGADRAVSEDPVNREAAWKAEVAVVGGENIVPGGLHADVRRECAVC